MKKKMMFILLLVITVFTMNIVPTHARENVYYTNSNGIELTEEEYKFLTTFYWDDYVENMTEEQYQEFANSDLLERRLITSSTEDMCQTRSPSHTTPYKNLKISAACSYNCTVSIVATWYVDPVVRSYDVIGAYLSGPSIISYANAGVGSTTSTNTYANFVLGSGTGFEGIGNSVLLPSSGNGIVVNQILTTTTGGHIFGSYQHAVQTVSLSTSKKYNFSLAGYGNVFAFYGSAVGKYDGMAGVDIYV